MTLAIDTVDGRGLSNEAPYELLSNKTLKVMLYMYWLFVFTIKCILPVVHCLTSWSTSVGMVNCLKD